MKNNKVSNLLNLDCISQILPGFILVLFLVLSWNSLIKLYYALIEGGNQVFQFQMVDKHIINFKVNLIYVALFDEVLNIVIFFCGICLLNYILELKIKISNELIQAVINNQLSYKELIFLRTYFAKSPIFYTQQLKLIDSRLQIKLT